MGFGGVALSETFRLFSLNTIFFYIRELQEQVEQRFN